MNPRQRLPLILALLAGPALAATAMSAKPQPETAMDPVSRPPPPAVADIVVNGLRYSQVISPRKLGLAAGGGWLVAHDAKTGEQRWTLRIYEVAINPADETDVQEVYFRSMRRVSRKNALTIINERGRSFVVDLDSRQVSAQP